jgi:hypothetical protein
MADDKRNRGPQDRSRINLSKDYEVRYWTDKLGARLVLLRRPLNPSFAGRRSPVDRSSERDNPDSPRRRRVDHR